MAKALLLGILVAFAASTGVLAQATTSRPAWDSSQGGPGIRAGNITATGETVPNPGVSQSGGTTSLDRGIQREDTRIQNSICRGC